MKREKVKIFCHTCGGAGVVPEKIFPTGQDIDCPCPECGGEGWIWDEKVIEEKEDAKNTNQ